MRGEQIGYRGERDDERGERPHGADSHCPRQDREVDDLVGAGRNIDLLGARCSAGGLSRRKSIRIEEK